MAAAIDRPVVMARPNSLVPRAAADGVEECSDAESLASGLPAAVTTQAEPPLLREAAAANADCTGAGALPGAWLELRSLVRDTRKPVWELVGR